MVEVTRIPGLGPKRVKVLHDHLGIGSLDELKEAVAAGGLDEVPGFGPKARDNVLAALEKGPETPRLLLDQALTVGNEIVDGLRDEPAALRVELAGSARRLADTVKDLDVVVAASDAKAVTKAFTKLPALESASVAGEAGAKGVTHTGLPVDLRIVPEESFGNLLQHFTGSGRHNEALRTAAVRKGLHVSEYGVKDDETDVTHSFADEREVYELLGMAWIDPELREDRGELDAAREKALPELITQDDLRGDLHCHTTASDGRNSILEMGQAALDRGYEYLAITDHSASHGFGNDVQPDELLRQVERIAEANEKLDGITLLAGTEVNVLTDGALDYADDVLEQLDWIVASLHTSFRMKEEEMTARMVAAMEHPLVDVIGHPTGRLIGRREPYALDTDRVVEVGRAHGHLPGDQRQPQPPRPARHAGSRRRRGGRDADDRLRRARRRHAPQDLVRRGHRAPRLADTRAGREHALVARARPAAQARQLAFVVGLRRRRPGAGRECAPAAGPTAAACGRTSTGPRRAPRSPARRGAGCGR